MYYYYCCSVAQARLAVQQQEPTTEGEVSWAEALADELLRRQGADGSWVNPLVPQREDDPLVATSLAALALACCRKARARLERSVAGLRLWRGRGQRQLVFSPSGDVIT